MAQPTVYERQYNFADFQESSPTDPLPADQIEQEFNSIKQTLDEVLERLELIQRDDGEIANDTIGDDQLTDEVTLGFNPASAWATLTGYTTADYVFYGNAFYHCIVAHTSGTFATDLAALKWELVADMTGAVSGPGTNDGAALGSGTVAWSDLYLAVGGVINWGNGDVTITHASNALAFAGATNGYTVDAVFSPATSDGAALGSTTKMWSDIFLATGAVVNFNNGDVTITHSTNALAFAGASSGYSFDAAVTIGGTAFIVLNSTQPTIEWFESDGATNAKYWLVNAAGGLFQMAVANDALNSFANFITVTRSGITVTEIQFDATDLDFNGAADFSGNVKVNGLFGVGPQVAYTIASGVITVTNSNVRVDTEASGATDDLDTINGGSEGDIIVIAAANDARTVVVKDGTGNIRTGGDRTLDNADDRVVLMKRDTFWVELAFAGNSA